MSKKFHITTFGCKMNEHDSEVLAGILAEKKYQQVDDKKEADVVIINTCSVRDNADKRFFGTLGEMKKKKLENPEFVVCVCGCMMQQQHVVDTIKSKYPWVDIIFGTHNIHQFPELLDNVTKEKKKLVEVWTDGGQIIEGLPVKRVSKAEALVNIMFGCNNFCTYCIVPYTRGRERSRLPREILKEVEHLVKDGVKEIMLLGQNVNSYKGEGDVVFADLIYQLNEIEGLERIRFMTSHPKDLSDKLIQAFVDCKKLCNSIHLPVQSGSNEVLEKMNRKYTREHYSQLVRKLRNAVPEITISTDIIIGFPGETEEHFLETMDLIKTIRFDSVFTFLYSVRKGTPAENFAEQVCEEVKHQRFNRLIEEINRISAEKNKAYAGKIQRVLVEGPSKTNDRIYTGRNEGFKPVNFQGNPQLIGQLVDVEITEGKTFRLDGRIVPFNR